MGWGRVKQVVLCQYAVVVEDFLPELLEWDDSAALWDYQLLYQSNPWLAGEGIP
ncbi:MAG: hypothetical protein NZ703_10505 [Gemmataceae bacterium]|nr:hypothetical protein [Gemmataceae bacterium]